LYGGTAMSSTNQITHRMGYRGDAVWGEYAAVWHMNEDSGVAYDSTAHGLDAQPSCGTNKLADVSQMVAYENGACGRARVSATEHYLWGNRMKCQLTMLCILVQNLLRVDGTGLTR
jgi:hypothetical protein